MCQNKNILIHICARFCGITLILNLVITACTSIYRKLHHWVQLQTTSVHLTSCHRSVYWCCLLSDGGISTVTALERVNKSLKTAAAGAGRWGGLPRCHDVPPQHTRAHIPPINPPSFPSQKLSQPTNTTETKHNHNGSLKGMETT